MFKVNNRNTRATSELCSKLTIKIPEQRQWRSSGIFIVNFEHIVNVEHVNAGWDHSLLTILFSFWRGKVCRNIRLLESMILSQVSFKQENISLV